MVNSRKYDDRETELLLISDMSMANNYLQLVGIDQNKDGDFVLTLITVDKNNLGITSKWDFQVSFPGYDITEVNILSFPKVYASYSQFFDSDILYIAFSIGCSGFDCSEYRDDAVWPVILWMIPPDDLRETPWTEAQLYRWNTTHWNYQSPYTHGNFTWATDIVKAGSMLYVVGFIGVNPDSADDGFVAAVNVEEPEDPGSPERLKIQYFLRLASLEGEADTGGPRGFSVVLGAGEYNGYAYLTGTASNYYLEYDPFNPLNITGTIDQIRDYDPPESQPLDLTELRNLDRVYDGVPIFDRDVSTAPAGFYGVLRLRPSGMTVTSTTTSTTTSTETVTSTTTETSTVTSTSTRTVTSTPTTTVTRFTTATQTSVATRVETEYVFSTVYTTRVVEGTVTRFETVTSVSTIPYITTYTDRTTLRLITTATTTPTVYATVQTTLNRTLTVRQTTTEAVVAEGYVPWPFLLLPFIPLLLLPPLVVANGRRLTVTILEGGGGAA